MFRTVPGTPSKGVSEYSGSGDIEFPKSRSLVAKDSREVSSSMIFSAVLECLELHFCEARVPRGPVDRTCLEGWVCFLLTIIS